MFISITYILFILLIILSIYNYCSLQWTSQSNSIGAMFRSIYHRLLFSFIASLFISLLYAYSNYCKIKTLNWMNWTWPICYILFCIIMTRVSKAQKRTCFRWSIYDSRLNALRKICMILWPICSIASTAKIQQAIFN